MELEDIQGIISKAIEQIKPDHTPLLINWLDEVIAKYRGSNLFSTPVQSVLTPKINHGQRFVCACGRSFSAEISIRETTNIETSSPPATPMLMLKTDLKHPQESNSKRQKLTILDSSTSIIPTTVTTTSDDGYNQSNFIDNWQTNLKTYEDSPEFINGESNRTESDIDLSSNESRCLEDIDAVLSPYKSVVSNFIYSNTLWQTSLSPSTTTSFNYSNTNHDNSSNIRQQSMITLKSVCNEPLSPNLSLIHDNETNKTVTTIHRRPMLVAYTDPEANSPTRPTQFSCTQCHETFDSLLLGQEHANNGMCSAETTINVLENSDSHLSPTTTSLFEPLQENSEEALNTRVDSKAACPICNKIFSSVHTMIRHKTSIHDRQVRYGCNICGRYFFRKDKLTSHMVYHQDFDSYVCCFCTVGCKSRMLMRQHLKRDHVMSNEDTCLNDLLNRCQVKKSLNLETNMSVAYTADRQVTSSKRNMNTMSIENDIKQTPSN